VLIMITPRRAHLVFLTVLAFGLVASVAPAKSRHAAFKARKIGVGFYTTCAVTPQGGAKCWGGNDFGSLGRGDFTHTSSLTPVNVVGLKSGVASIAGGLFHECALTTRGGVKCWGGSLDNGTRRDAARAVDVPGLRRGIRALAAGEGTCALTKAGAVKCWGLGRTAPGPRTVRGLGSGATAIAVGNGHACAVVRGGAVECWGDNRYGQLGNGTIKTSSTPVHVLGLRGAVAVATGDWHTCALTRAGGVVCWGDGNQGDLGNGSRARSTRPVRVVGLQSGVTAIAAGGSHSCALTRAGVVKCWGESGANGRSSDSPVPAWVSLGGRAVSIDAGGPHTCALLRGGQVRCWGYNGNGELGNGTTKSSSKPVIVRARPLPVIVQKLIIGSNSITFPGLVNDLSANGAKVALRRERGKSDRPCAQLLVWTPAKRSGVRLRELCSSSNASHYVYPTLAGNRLFWTDYTFGLEAYCTGPYGAVLPKIKPTLFGLCDGTEPDRYLDIVGDGNLVVTASFDYCAEGRCTDPQGGTLPEGVYNVELFRLSGNRFVPLLPAADGRVLLGVAEGRILVDEPSHQVVVYDETGTVVTSVPVHTDAVQAALAGTTLVVRDGTSLGLYDAATGAPQVVRTIPARANLRNASGGLAVYTYRGVIHLIRLSDGNDIVFRSVPGIVDAQLEAAGLVYAYNRGGLGHGVLVPVAKLPS